MKQLKLQFVLAITLLIIRPIFTQNTNPEVTNVAFSISGTTVTVTYDLYDAEQSTVTISMQVSSDNGATWDFSYGPTTPTLPASVSTGTGKTITWEYSGAYNPNFKIRIYANDESADGSPCPGVATIDYGGKTYNTIQIGTQCWLKENLDVGTRINGNQNPLNDGVIEKFCYDDNPSNCSIYGGLYTGAEACQYAPAMECTKGICPNGWHLPTKEEFETLKGSVNDNGRVLKKIGQGTGNGAGTNTSGFSALLAGTRSHTGYFGHLQNYAFYWSSMKPHQSSTDYMALLMYNSSSDILIFLSFQEQGYSVRCIKNENGQGSTPSVPTLASPGDLTIDQSTSPTLSWNASTGATSYRLQVSTSDQFTTTLYDQSNLTSTSQTVGGLAYSTQYYWRVNATNNYGTSGWSSVWSFTTGSEPCPGIPTVSYEGKTYNTVKIGTQCWLKENLNIGTMINSTNGGTSNDGNQTNNGTVEKYCYNNDANNCATYGGLYQWNEAMQYVTNEGAQGICPTGWHVPTYSDFQALSSAVGGSGNALKEIGQGSGSGTGTNTSGFSALLAGYRSLNTYFLDLGDEANLWSSTEYYTTYAYYMYLRYSDNDIYLNYSNKGNGVSVRCIKNEIPTAPILNSPTNGAVDQPTSPTLSWNASTGADSYQLQVSTSDQFTTTMYDQSNITSTNQQLNGLSYSTQYYWRVNATNGYGTSAWSSVWSFTTQSFLCGSSITYSGKAYNTIQIGVQCWLKENLDVGTMIQGNQNPANNSTIEKYCYNNDANNCATYGGLYQWNEAMQYLANEGAQGICPSGWHIPTYSDFQALSSAVGGSGNALKEIGQGSGSGTGTNTSGFSALLAGRYYNNTFYSLGSLARFWSSKLDTANAYYMSLSGSNSTISFNKYSINNGISIRCIRNNEIPSAPILNQPANGKIDEPTFPTLSWNSSNGAESYRLQVSTSDQFTTTVYDESNITSINRQVNGLNYSTQYYWRVNATNNYGTSGWSSVWSFTTGSEPCPGIPTVSYEGKTYNTVKIGTQCWLKENLDIGTRINGNQNPSNDGNIEKYCYNNLDTNCIKYGGLYQWNEAMQYVTNEGAQGICPTGWHIPTNSEFQTLKSNVSDDGNALKAIGQGSGSGAGTNASGFSALLVGHRFYDGSFDRLVEGAYFWSSIKNISIYADYMSLHYNNSVIYFDNNDNDYGFSIRCIKNGIPPAPILNSPANGAVNQSTSPALSWNASTGADSYQLQVSTSDQFTTTMYDQSNITSTNQQLNGLSYSTQYYWRVNATNSNGTSEWSSIYSFTTEGFCPATVDYSGKIYNTVLIGTQCWLKENLDVGTMIQGNEHQLINGTIEKYCYENNLTNCNTFGGLYTGPEANGEILNTSQSSICPTGWHIPTLEELQALTTTVNNDGNALKAIGQGSGGGAGTNTSGFSALLAGYCDYYGGFHNLENYSHFWSSTILYPSSTEFKTLLLYSSDNNILLYNSFQENGYSVRCLKD